MKILTRFASRLAGIAAIAGCLTACHGTWSEDPPVHLMQNMDFQDRYDSQEVSAFFADKRAMRKQVEGTVAQGLLKDNDHYYRGRDNNGRLVTTLPGQVPFSKELIARGRERYDIYCAPCHDESGRGEGIVTKRGGGLAVRPPSFHDARLTYMPLGFFFDVMTNGVGKAPNQNMLSYAAQIPVQDRWAIAVWVRTLQVHGHKNRWNDEQSKKEGK
jgi:mono/diheme cytochrome c family protein